MHTLPWMWLHQALTLVSPSHGATDQPTTTTFEWEAFTGADHYHLFYTPDGGAEVEVADIAGTSHQVSGLDPNTRYTWYVLAHNDSDEIIAIGESETWEFTTVAGSDKHSRTSMSIGIGIGL